MKRKATAAFAFFLVLAAYFYIQNNGVTVTQIEVSSRKIPEAFSGYKILQVSDLHNKSFSEDQVNLTEKMTRIKPDVIVFTGDLVDSKRYSEDEAVTLARKSRSIAPVYFVTGNHEWLSGKYSSLEKKLKKAGVIVLRNEAVELSKGPDSVRLMGIDDPAAESGGYNEPAVAEKGIRLAGGEEKSDYTILLSHRPELLQVYAKYNVDLVFSGHAHGGQVRLPFIGGLIAPNQGLLPKLTVGKHTSKDTTMVISRGLGNSVIPVRAGNQPELVVVSLRKNGQD
ncbi:metallophosphoesterase [Metabacillus mangrovi]|uniref:metallophosphoesterase n=1 Tax=Metabacillus mangrovi TaxID=1491830 RepID=UPI003D311E13